MYQLIAALVVVFGCAYGEAALSVDPDYATLYVFAPSPMNISCRGELETGETLDWYKGTEKANTAGFLTTQKIIGEKQVEVTLSKTTTDFNDAGDFKCQKGSSESQALKVVVVKVTKVQAEYNRTMKTATLACQLAESTSRAKDAVYTMHWEFDGVEVKDSDKYDIFEENGTLVIHEPERKDTGEYVCVFTFNRQIQRIPVSFKATPYVKHFDKSKNLIQGDPLTLRCTVYAYPKAEISWLKDNMNVDDIENIEIMTDEKSGLENGMLRIASVDFEDKGEYTCIAFSPAYNRSDNSSIIVRVKDKLAALWPFLGIVAEVIVLCVIIFIYEKRRSKNDDDEDAADTGNCANAADHKASEVRQRNVRA